MFDPPPIFATAKTVVASNAAELRRYANKGIVCILKLSEPH